MALRLKRVALSCLLFSGMPFLGVGRRKVVSKETFADRTHLAGDEPKVKGWPVDGKFENLGFLASGSTCDVFLARDLRLASAQYDEKVVLKVFFTPEIEGSSQLVHATQELAKINSNLKTTLAEAVVECEYAMKFQEDAADERNTQRLMACYGHNIVTAEPNEALYSVVENSGGQSLFDYFIDRIMHMGSNDIASIVASIIRQTVEGLDYLASKKLVHHDIKPENIVVKDLDRGRVAVRLVDFGAMMPADGDVFSKGTVSPGYIPYEWLTEKPATAAHDIYALGNTISFLTTCHTMHDGFNKAHDRDEYVKINAVAGYPVTTFLSHLSQTCINEEVCKVCGWADERVILDHDFREFAVEWAHTFRKERTRRPTASQLLKLPWLQQADSPDDPDSAWMTKKKSTVASTPSVIVKK